MSDWFLMRPPELEDEGRYDIRLDDGMVVFDVEYWAFGGGFKAYKKGDVLPRGRTQGMVHYLRGDVISFRKVTAREGENK